ncbi:acyltransferase [Sphingobacterium faecium]|uniref:acyltransferase family protein n=1 Tax=Sphingobacterium faecium TaxID=34087 RepID=UPI0021B6192A|nr:acyltransferase family protein [Sphingobacterium faecium]UXD69405.1 acyltransferase [Sphingobacterium faecium]
MNFRNDIQGLRAIAVLFVFIFHLSSTYLPGGFIGVDMFFVISGYLISKIVQSKISDGKFKLLDFYIGRVKRIVPAYYFMFICAWIICMFIFVTPDLGKFKLSHFHSVLFNSNNYLATVDNYFGASATENPFLHTWTLSVEMQFYFILPVLLLLIRNVKALLITLLIISLSLFVYGTMDIYNGNKATVYFSLLARSPEFFIGVILALSRVEELTIIKKNASILSFVGLIILLASALLLTESSLFPGLLALIPCLAIGLILISPAAKLNQIIANKKIAYIGEISYSIYLWHWPIMAFYRYYNERYEFTLAETLLVVALTITASLISYYLIEKPFRRKEGFKFYALMAVLAILNIFMIYFTLHTKRMITDIPEKYILPSFGLQSHGRFFEHVEVFGDTTYANKRILLLGDSHALTFKPYLNQLGKEHGFSFRTVTNDEYPALPFIEHRQIVEKKNLDVYLHLEPYIHTEVKSADIILILFAGEGKRWKNSIQKMLDKSTAQQRIIFISDYPSLDRNPVRSNKHFIKDPSRNISYKLTLTKIDPDILTIINGHPNSSYVDLSAYIDFFKDIPFHNDTLMYYDGSHLNEFGAERFSTYSGHKILESLKLNDQ